MQQNMERFLKRKAPDINWEEEIKYDPGLRKEIDSYHPNHREKVRRKYLENRPCQPRTCIFPSTQIGGKDNPRRFQPEWFDEFGGWLEYSESKDRAYCFCCFLFREKKDAGYKAFVVEGWNGFHRKERLKMHVGNVGGAHYIAMKKCDDLLQRNNHINVVLHRQSEASKRAYFTRLNGSIDTSRLLLKQGLPFRGHDESKESLNKGNFLEVFDCLADHDPDLGKAVGLAGNSCMVAHEIQTDIVECFANEILHSILEELGDDVFCLLVDESRDVSCKEQMAVVLRSSIDSLLAKFKLSLKKVRGQGYDGASNMRGEFNGLQSLILRESRSAYYVHCFAHQLQLVIVAVVRKHKGISNFFTMIHGLLNVVGGSAKRRDMIRDINHEKVSKALGCGQLETGRGLNQEQCLQRPRDTRWSSHCKPFKSLVELFSTVVEVLQFVEKDDREWRNRDQASNLLIYFQSFDFVFYLHLLLTTLTITNTLSQALQRKDQDIVNAMKCLHSTKLHLCDLRRDGWSKLLDEVNEFCEMHDITRLEMEDAYIDPKRSRKASGITNKHHYEVDCFNEVIDWLVQELNSRFSETSSQLLVCSAAFNPRDSFHDFDVESLVNLAKLYPDDFSSMDLRDLRQHLGLYIADVREDNRFSNISTISELSQRMVATKKNICYPLVYRLLKLVLLLPIATATVERIFSGMKIVKTTLSNRMGDAHLSNRLICYVDKEELKKVTNDAVVQRFMNMEGKGRRFDL